jgi:glycosyltransferase involved in cell wall biosynthesis
MIKFSIIIINYNNAAYLKRSINSAIEQTYQNKEIIVYDDCSIDNSRKIISKFRNVKKIWLPKSNKWGGKMFKNCKRQFYLPLG